ncbi:hypothetical protein [Kitasatospora aburaviensis]|uniref:Uncharacterized protein n=1 Tax=Kitasatospora aburaviensis TaxID=67265 RepID=A0ABW1F3K5_9ACTN
MKRQLSADPAWFLAQHGYQAQALSPVPVSATARLTRWLARNPSKVWPTVAALCVLGLARWFHADGALEAGSIAGMTGLSVAGAAAGLVSAAKQHGDSTLTAAAFALSAGSAVFEIAAMTPHLPLALFLTLGPLILAYTLGARSWRDDRRAREQREHEKDLAELNVFRDVRVAELAVQERQQMGMYAVALAEALQHRTGLDAADGQVLPGVTVGSTVRALPAAPAPDQYSELLASSLLQPTVEQLTAWNTARKTG